jgi:hypothetical protein
MPAHEEQRERLLAALPPKVPDELPAVVQYRTALSARWTDPMANEERIDNIANSALMRRCGPLSNLPLMVVSRGKAQAPAGLPPALVKRQDQAWRQMQYDLAALSSHSVHLIAEQSGHLINEEQPDMIEEGIRLAQALVRNHADLVPGDGTL